jgi:galactoside O-acetyltransferase
VPLQNNFYSDDELCGLNFLSIGKNVSISRNASFYDISKISIGNNVRIDDFCILSGKISIGNYVHISAYNALYGGAGIIIKDFCGLSPRCCLFSRSDDFSGNYMISPMVPNNLTNVKSGSIILENFVQLGTNSVIMPGITCQEGSVTGALTFVDSNLDPWSINCGIPSKKIKNRNKKLLQLSKSVKNA